MEKELEKNIKKTGTTTLGIVCRDGIVLAADKRGIYGSEAGVTYLASRDEEKILKVNDRLAVTIAGVASDLEKVIKLVRAELKLKQLRTNREASTKEAANLFGSLVYQNIRQFSPILGITHFLLAGYDCEGFYLYEVWPDGHIQEMRKFSATGSGMMQCHPLLDSEYKQGVNVQEGIKLALKCINAAMRRDPATGEGIDVYVVDKKGIRQEIKERIESKHVREEDKEGK